MISFLLFETVVSIFPIFFYDTLLCHLQRLRVAYIIKDLAYILNVAGRRAWGNVIGKAGLFVR